ncbi:uncharacterized protein BDR25DRAFT_53517 [Lindgomyces ingoldianus]|uniref:Uncharacterized protein n=1 Tax=Lindgomyces ingoldianus TaxID=673940 RepID=A0ACB6QPQ8_9PLEO|nr:uncharacterized protein BDR25DRAFT_53517 [Lindgomyces ingoldianus]KAF2468842.1 hypothetical protein BDR25DRAFT_53517 [Lindgomyces ingoldianus]
MFKAEVLVTEKTAGSEPTVGRVKSAFLAVALLEASEKTCRLLEPIDRVASNCRLRTPLDATCEGLTGPWPLTASFPFHLHALRSFSPRVGGLLLYLIAIARHPARSSFQADVCDTVACPPRPYSMAPQDLPAKSASAHVSKSGQKVRCRVVNWRVGGVRLWACLQLNPLP